MVPDLNEEGFLPPGIHMATTFDVTNRFGVGSDQRRSCCEAFQSLVRNCRQAGIRRLLVGGSFVTNHPEPGDVDCILVGGQTFRRDSEAAQALAEMNPYLHLHFVDTPDDLAYY